MTGSGVERTQRAATRPMLVPFGGVSASLLPASQGVEGRSGRLAGRAGFRWGLRTLVIGGFAGAAWLLTGAAAHAAGPDAPVEAPTSGLSVVSLVNGLGTEADEQEPADRAANATGVLANLPGDRTTSPTDAAPKPAVAAAVTPLVGVVDRLDRLVPVHGDHQPSGVTGRTDRAPGVPARTDTGDVASAVPGLNGIARVLTAPLRHIDGPVGSRGSLTPVTRVVTEPLLTRVVSEPLLTRVVTGPLRTTLRPVTDLLHDAASPVTDVLGPVLVRVPDALWSPVPTQPLAPVAAAAAAGSRTTLGVADPVGAKQAASGRPASAQRFAAADLPETGTPNLASGVRPGPDRPGPAPLRAWERSAASRHTDRVGHRRVALRPPTPARSPGARWLPTDCRRRPVSRSVIPTPRRRPSLLISDGT